MPSHLIWSLKAPRRGALEGVGGAVELRYDGAGFASAWVVMVDGRATARCPDLCAAKDAALALAANRFRTAA